MQRIQSTVVQITYGGEAKEWAAAAERILQESPDSLPPTANRCQSGEHALYQQVDSRTLTQNVMALA